MAADQPTASTPSGFGSSPTTATDFNFKVKITTDEREFVGGGWIWVSRTREARPWLGRTTPAEATARLNEAKMIGRVLVTKVRAHEMAPQWADWGAAQMLLIRRRSTGSGPPFGALGFGWSSEADVGRMQAEAVRRLIRVAFNTGIFVESEGRLYTQLPDQWVIKKFGDLTATWREMALRVLRDADLPDDQWYQSTLIAYLLLPNGFEAVLSLPHWLSTPPAGESFLACQPATANGSSERTQRAAAGMCTDLRRKLGSPTVEGKRGPKTSSHRQKSDEVDARDQYLLARAKIGVSAQVLVTDAEAQRLHRLTKQPGEPAALLTEAIVYQRLRVLGEPASAKKSR